MAEVDKLFTKGEEAFQKRNYDYAIDLFKQIILIDPDHVKSHQALRAVALKKSMEQGSKGGFFGGLGSRFGALSGSITKNSQKKIDNLLDLTVKNPNDVNARVSLAKAFKEGGHVEGAIVELEMANAVDKNHVDGSRTLGDLYREKGDFTKAIECYQIVVRQAPEDRHAAGSLKDLLAMGSMKEGWSDAKGSRDVIKDKGKAAELADSHKVYKTDEEMDSEIADLKAKIDADPESPLMAKPWAKIGELQMRQSNWAEAAAAFEEARRLDPNDMRLKAKIGDVKVKEWEAQIVELIRQCKEDPENAEFKLQLQAVKTEKLQFQIADWKQRIKDHPTELGLRYELGTFLMQAGQVDEAIKEFQQTVKDPKRKLESLDFLGQAFFKKKMYELAAGQFAKALDVTTNPAKELALRYNLGKCFLAARKKKEALAEFEKVVEIDFNYRDAAKLVEDLKDKETEEPTA